MLLVEGNPLDVLGADMNCSRDLVWVLMKVKEDRGVDVERDQVAGTTIPRMGLVWQLLQ